MADRYDIEVTTNHLEAMREMQLECATLPAGHFSPRAQSESGSVVLLLAVRVWLTELEIESDTKADVLESHECLMRAFLALAEHRDGAGGQGLGGEPEPGLAATFVALKEASAVVLPGHTALADLIEAIKAFPELVVRALKALDFAAFSRRLAQFAVSLEVRAGKLDDTLEALGPPVNGSGALVEYRGRYFVATCGHTFKLVRRDSFLTWVFGKPRGGNHPGERPREETEVHIHPRYSEVTETDLALIEVDPSDFTPRHTFWRLDGPPEMIGNGWLCGFGGPGKFHDRGAGGELKKTYAVSLSGMLNIAMEWDGARNRYPQFRVPIDETAYVIGEDERESPDTYAAMSGGGVWCQWEGGGLRLIGLLLGEYPKNREPGVKPTHFGGVYVRSWMEFADSFLDSEQARAE